MLSTSDTKFGFQIYYLQVGQKTKMSSDDSEIKAKKYFEAYGYTVLRSKEEANKIIFTGIIQSEWKNFTKIFTAGIPDFFVYKLENNKVDWFFVEVKKLIKHSSFSFTPNQIKWYMRFLDYMPTALLIVEYLSYEELKERIFNQYKRMNLEERQKFVAKQEKINTDITPLIQEDLNLNV
jgi:hypothetical protein